MLKIEEIAILTDQTTAASPEVGTLVHLVVEYHIYNCTEEDLGEAVFNRIVITHMENA